MRPQLDHVLLGDLPGDSPWSRATGRVYDVRTDLYGEGGYSFTVNRDRIGPGTTGWICLRDGSFGFVAGICLFSAGVDPVDHDGIVYAPGVIYPFPREYWIDGARIQLSGWSGRAPFKRAPNRFRNGEAIQSDDVKVLFRLLPEPTHVWWRAIRQQLSDSKAS